MKVFAFGCVDEGYEKPTAATNDVDRNPYPCEWLVKRLDSGTWCTPLEPWMLDYYPTVAKINRKKFQLTPWVMYVSLWGVSQGVKDIIEKFEPGKHQFIPVNIQYGEPGSWESLTYYTLQINSINNDVDVSKSDVRWTETYGTSKPVRYWAKKSHIPVVLSLASVAGLHLWRNERISSWMMSGELHDAFEHEGLTAGLKFQEQFVL